MDILKAQCPLCQWSARQQYDDKNELETNQMKSIVAKALMMHLRKHARHDKNEIVAGNKNIAFSTGFGADSRKGFVEMSMNDEIAQIDIEKARKIHQMLGQAIEAAVTDELIYLFFSEKVGLGLEKISQIMYDLRMFRQGSAATIDPS